MHTCMLCTMAFSSRERLDQHFLFAHPKVLGIQANPLVAGGTVSVSGTSNTSGQFVSKTTQLSVGSQGQGPQPGAMRMGGNGRMEVYDGSQWLDVTPTNMNPGSPTTLADALAMSIQRALGGDFDKARVAATDVVNTLHELGFEITPEQGSVVTENREADYDFTDFCGECDRAAKDHKDWDGDGLQPDRFCLFHRGYVSGALAEGYR